ncbi:O-antigen ligase family protein [Trichlorobacter lovleyi]|uniref:O-antigen ligase family protein n=1 Tax=Trichlorobacter lovleyi TaxID=313985 RepID=UPI00223EFC26|nr:O-antigen ligase family protein [Trichlorobacter lovleyi]QOX78543.1 O-antigen ligase family protein [Trichlorobacter lovleyi]
MSALAVSTSVFKWQKKWLWLATLLPLLFISDILYGGLEYYGIQFQVTPGVVLRGMVVLIAIYMTMHYWHLVDKPLLIWITFMSLSVLPSILVGIFRGGNFFYDVSALSKVLYLPLVTGLFVALVKVYDLRMDDILRFIEYGAYVLGVSLLISQKLGIQKQTYGDYAFGSTGIFYAQNDMTLALGLGLLSGGYLFVMMRFSWLRLWLLAMSSFACVQIGTRASLAAVVGTALTAILCVIWGKTEGRGIGAADRIKKWLAGFFMLVIMSGILVYGLTKQQEFSYQQQKLEEVASGDFPRLLLVLAGAEQISNRAAIFDFVGEGADAFQRGVARYFPKAEKKRMVEVDWMDIFGGYGIGFTILIHLFVVLVLLKSSLRFVIKRGSCYGLIAAATLFYLGHSAIAGHALTSPIPSTLMAGYLSIFFTNKVFSSSHDFNVNTSE